jgi:hypothetical protein
MDWTVYKNYVWTRHRRPYTWAPTTCAFPQLDELTKESTSEYTQNKTGGGKLGRFVWYTQSNELTRGPSELVQHFRLYRGSSHRRKSAVCPKFDMVWLYRSPIPVGRRGLISRSTDFYLPSLQVEEGGRGSAPCGGTGLVASDGWQWQKWEEMESIV